MVEGAGFLTAEQTAAYGRFVGVPTVAELDQFFVLDDEDLKLVAKRRRDTNRLGFMVQLTTLRYLGTFLDDPLDVPTVVVEQLAAQLGIADPSCVKAYSGRENTRWAHRREICEQTGWVDYAGAASELGVWLERRAWNTGESSSALFFGAVTRLRARQVQLPGITTLTAEVSRARTAAESRLWAALVDQITAGQASLLVGLLEVQGSSRVSALEVLRRGPVDRSGKALVAALQRIDAVASLGVGGVDLGVVPQRRVRELARDGTVRNATALRRRSPYAKQVATLLAAVVFLEARATDDALELFDVIMTNELLARAERASKTDRLHRYPKLSRDARRLAAAVEVMLDAGQQGPEFTIQALWTAIGQVVSIAELRTAVLNVNESALPLHADQDDQWRAELTRRYPLVRKFLSLLVDTIDFGATADAAGVLVAFQGLPGVIAAHPTRRVPPGWCDEARTVAGVVTAGWRPFVFPKSRPPGTVDRNAYLFCVLEQFHARLKRRDIYAAKSSRWADPRAQLLEGPVWEARRVELLDSLQLPFTPTGLLDDCAAELDATWQYTAARAAAGDIRVDRAGRLHAAALEARAEPESLRGLRHRCQEMMPRVDIGELVLEVMGWQPGFAQAYTHISGGGARVADLNVTLAAVLTAQALNVGWGPVTSPGVPALTRSRISHVYQNYVRPECHSAANAALIDGQAGIPTAMLWGGGLVAAVDGTRFVVPVRSIDARPNPKYFGRRKGATWLNMINDHGTGIAGMVLSGTPKDSLHAVDLLYRRDGGARPEVFISDTGSYSDAVFGLLKLLGVAYRPELADLPDQKLWRTDPSADYGPADAAARGRIDLAKIDRHWADITRIAASVHAGEVAAADVMRLLQHGGQPTQLGFALAHFGRIFKTLHVLSYLDAEPYRRGIKRMRNLSEERHGLAKHVFHGRRGELREPYHAGMEDQLSALGLVINAITLWNTVYLDRILTELRETGLPVSDEDVTRLHPYWFKHINVHGHYAFTLPTLAGGVGTRTLREPESGESEES